MYKAFNEHSHIIAIKETGNVYSYEAYQTLNKDPKHYYDLLTSKLYFDLTSLDDKFDPKKIILI
jgi:peptidyl-prolyl cis-trans isomerase-like protein 2